MPDGDRVGSAYVDIHVNAAPGEAELAAFKSKVDRDFAELDRKKAEAKVKLDAVEFDRTIEKVKTELDNLKRKKASVTIEADTKQLDADIAEAEAELKALTSKKRTIQIDSRQVKAAHDAERLLAKEQALTERQAIQSAKAERALSSEREKAVTRTVKERAELAKLSAEYEKLRGRQVGLEKSSRRVFSPRSVGVADNEARKLERVASEADYVKHKIEALGGSVEHLDPQLSRNSSFIDKWLSRLGDTSIRIGPLTTSVKGLAAGLGLLGPLVFELGGGLTALAGTVGEGLAGAFTVGAGAAAGFALSAAGIGFVIGPMVGEFKEVHSATTALSKAQLKYGKDSTQAKTAQEQLNHELKGVSPIAKEGIQAWGGLKDRWKELTKAARPAVFNAFGQSLKTVQSLLPAFASESTKTTQVASKAWDGWMKSLRSSEAKGLLKSIMGDFRASIPGLADGLGSLVAMMGRLSAAGAHFLPGLSNGFAEWANNLEQSVGGGQKLTSEVGSMVSQMRDLGHLTQDTGSLLVHIFDAGSHSGQGMVKSLDQVIRRWDKWTQSASGKNGLQEFFGDSKNATEDFMSSLSHLTKLLFEFSRATAPVANGLLQIVTWIGDLVSAADQVVGIKQAFQALGLVLGGLFIVSKVSAYGDAITGVLARMGLMQAVTDADTAATEALTAAVAENTAALAAQGAAAGEASVALGAEGIAADAGAAEAGLAGAAEGAGLLSAALAPEVLIPAAAIAGLAILIGNLGDVETAWDQTQAAFKQSGREIPKTLAQMTAQSVKYVETQHSITKATNEANDARQRVLKLAKEGASPEKQTRAQIALNDAIAHQTAAERDLGRQNTISAKGAKQTLKVQEDHLNAAHEALKVAREQRASAVRQREIGFNGERPESRADALKKLQGAAFGVATAEGEVARARQLVAQASRQATASGIPLERQIKHLGDITPETERGLHKLVETIGSAATKKIGSFVNPQDVAKVTNLGNQLNKLGRGGQVKDIAVKSSGADQTISKLQRLQKQTNKVENSRASIKIGANDTQAQKKLQRLGALSQKVTGSRNTIKILANANSAEQAIQRLRQNLEHVARAKYKAEVNAVDRTQPGWEPAYHHLREVASKKYEARISAVDNASSVAKKAEGNAKKAGQQHPKVNISATDNASSIIQGVAAKLQALNGQTAHTTVVNTTENVIVTKHKNGATGGVFAAGGQTPSDRVIERAGRQASDDTRGRSRRVQTPRYLVGEEQGHPEYVIATNPAYRDSNERYLEAAAGDLGYTVIPAYKTGKGAAKKKTSAGSSGSKSGPKGHPKKQSKSHYYLKHNKFSSQATEEYNTTEKDISLKENLYNKEVEREEKEIEHKQREEWDWPTLRGYLTDERNDYRHLGGLTKQIRTDTNQAIKSAHKKVKNLNGPIKGTRKEVSKLSGEYSAITAPSKGKMSDAEYEEAKKHTKARKRRKDKEKKEAETRLKKLEKEKENALTIEREAKEKLNEIGSHSGSIFEKENEIKEEEAQTELTYFQGELEERTKPDETGASELPSYGEQTATLSAEREKLFNEFGSNVSGYFGPQAGTRTPLGANTGEYAMGGSAAGAATAAASVGPGGYVTAATKRYANGLPTNAYATGGGGKVGGDVNVTNNFAAPPPDPHTWAKQQTFELGALAG